MRAERRASVLLMRQYIQSDRDSVSRDLARDRREKYERARRLRGRPRRKQRRESGSRNNVVDMLINFRRCNI